MLEQTLVIWMGEFGRTPTINSNNGRDHLAGQLVRSACRAGIRGGQAFGATTDDGARSKTTRLLLKISLRRSAQDWARSETTNLSNIVAPIPLADHGSNRFRNCCGHESRLPVLRGRLMQDLIRSRWDQCVSRDSFL